ncbi:hypothetical protein D3C86_2113530 [compost metagenome]
MHGKHLIFTRDDFHAFEQGNIVDFLKAAFPRIARRRHECLEPDDSRIRQSLQIVQVVGDQTSP